MDRVLRAYAHTAWTSADPLHGLDENVRRAILLMPSTFRERWKLAPWTDRHQRRMAVVDIIAERRLLYELTEQRLTNQQPTPTNAQAPAAATVHDQTASPYYRYRLAQHRHALDAMHTERSEQDLSDYANIPAARADRSRLDAKRKELLLIEIERSKLDVKELEILATDATQPRRDVSKRKERTL